MWIDEIIHSQDFSPLILAVLGGVQGLLFMNVYKRYFSVPRIRNDIQIYEQTVCVNFTKKLHRSIAYSIDWKWIPTQQFYTTKKLKTVLWNLPPIGLFVQNIHHCYLLFIDLWAMSVFTYKIAISTRGSSRCSFQNVRTLLSRYVNYPILIIVSFKSNIFCNFILAKQFREIFMMTARKLWETRSISRGQEWPKVLYCKHCKQHL